MCVVVVVVVKTRLWLSQLPLFRNRDAAGRPSTGDEEDGSCLWSATLTADDAEQTRPTAVRVRFEARGVCLEWCLAAVGRHGLCEEATYEVSPTLVEFHMRVRSRELGTNLLATL